MSMSDPIADMLTRVRNALKAKQDATEVDYSRMKAEIARTLKREGYITDYVVEGGGWKKVLRIHLKYADGQPVIRGLRRVSKPGLRRYVNIRKPYKVLGGLGTVILSTSSGIMTWEQAHRQKTGGEVLCEVW